MALRDGQWPIHRLPQQTPWAHPWPMLREQRGRHPPSECPLSNHGDGWAPRPPHEPRWRWWDGGGRRGKRPATIGELRGKAACHGSRVSQRARAASASAIMRPAPPTGCACAATPHMPDPLLSSRLPHTHTRNAARGWLYGRPQHPSGARRASYY